MKYLVWIAAAVMIGGLGACKSKSSQPRTLCDTACLTDTLKFTGDHPLHPQVFINPANCVPATISWRHDGLGAVRTTEFGFSSVQINKDLIRCVFNDTSYVFVLFNDCLTGRGYQIKLPFSKEGTISKRSSGINNTDPKFNVSDDMIAYTDRGNIFVEEVQSGKKAMMTFGKALDIDYDEIHEFIDSVSVSNQRIWVRVKVDNEWKDLEKKIKPE